MNTSQQDLEAINDIRKIMERSSRFISLSGWSGISAGLIALAGAWIARQRMVSYYKGDSPSSGCPSCLRDEFILIAALVFVAAFISAALFTYIKSKNDRVPFWGSASRRLIWNTVLPMLAGGALIWKMIDLQHYELIVPSTLIFYGLALVNGSKYTMGEVRYLGYAEILTGLVSLVIMTGGIYVWAFGFGILHIVYGVAMWWQHERRK